MLPVFVSDVAIGFLNVLIGCLPVGRLELTYCALVDIHTGIFRRSSSNAVRSALALATSEGSSISYLFDCLSDGGNECMMPIPEPMIVLSTMVAFEVHLLRVALFALF